MRQLGYVETGVHTGMSAREVCHPVPTAVADVPDMTEYELAVPGDIVNLWTKYRSLPPERQRQFLAAASKLQEALSHWGERDTASFTSMVVACEALKPDDPAYSDHNLYDVVEALLGREASERLRTQLFDPKIHPKVHPQSESQRPAVIVQRRIPSTGRQSVYHNVLHLDAVVLMIASSLCVVSRACSEGMEPRHARK